MKKWSIDFFSDNVMDCQVETWIITDGVVSFETDSVRDAEWLCNLLNGIEKLKEKYTYLENETAT